MAQDESPTFAQRGSALPILPWLTRFELERDCTPAELAEMLAVHRRRLDELRGGGSDAEQDLRAQQQLVRFLEKRLKELTAAPAEAALALSPSQLAEWADIFQFEVPPSHRGKLGLAVTQAKRAWIGGLKPFHIESLRPQLAFNHALVEAFHALSVPTCTPEERRSRTGPQLDAFADPTQWSVPSHRGDLVGRAVSGAKRTYLRALEPLLRTLFEGQHAWNKAAAAFVRALASEAPEADLESLLFELISRVDPLSSLEQGAPAALRGSLALWRELFRRQTTFNHRMSSALRALLDRHHAGSSDYARWIRDREPAQISAALAALPGVKQQPLLSLVVPTWNTPEAVLRECFDSVLAQPYSHWELCVVDDASPAPHVRKVIEEYAARDSRIRPQFLERNGGIAVASNHAIGAARGEWVCFLDHDDVLAPHALAEVVLELERHPHTDVLYSDEDRLSPEGVRMAPFFKPDWSPDLLRSGNYVCHFLVIRREVLEQIGRVRTGFDGAQDYDLILRATEKARRVGHIPRVLYHWRSSPQSMALDVGNKPDASLRGQRAVQDHLARCGEDAVVEVSAPTTYRVKYPVRGEPLVSIIVPFKDKPELLDQLVTSLLAKTRYPRFELLLVSNNSVKPETFALLERLTDPRIRKLTWDHAFNFSAINNWAVRHAKGELLLFLNNDIEIIEEGWLEELIGQAQRPEVGAVGPKLLFPNGTLQHAGVIVGIEGFAAHAFPGGPNDWTWTAFGHANWTRNYLAVTAACLMMRRDVFEAVNGFDERFIVCGSDVELCLRTVERGLRVIYTPATSLVHHESATRRTDTIPEDDFWRSYVAYRPWLRDGDPYYNPNLSLRAADGSFRVDERTGEELAITVLARELPSSRIPPLPRARVDFQRQVFDKLPGLDYSEELIETTRKENPARIDALRTGGRLERITWFLPYFGHPYGGVHTILRFAHLFRTRHGVTNHFVIYDNPDADARALEARVRTLFPEPPGTFEVLRRREDVKDLRSADLGIATLWSSAYCLLDYPGAPAKAYFIQDYEPVFYPAGTYAALAEQSYRMGLYGIFNTRGLKEFVCSNYPMSGVSFEPAVEPTVFHDRRPPRTGPVRIFFYGRPSVDRNAFELGLAVLRQLKREFGADVSIVTAGEPWSPQDYGVAGAITNLGVLPYEKTGDLYRSTDIGLCFMFSKHPSYPPMEMMACGVTVVTNDNPANLWLFEDGRNCLLSEPTYASVLAQLRRAVSDGALRTRLGAAAAKRMRQSTWEAQADKIFETLTGREQESGSSRRRPLAQNA